ncbi:MAG: SMP-30/gluconolactonase/LRE family protein [Chloroflexi bacterium]|nr:SMP-30/gluconolactonase/LRE family protein [Chloroflexota bacterium]
MTTTALKLKYVDNVGFCADQGGRGFMMPTAMAIRDDGRIFVASRSNTTALNIIGIQEVTRHHDYFGQIGKYGRESGQMIWPTALAVDKDQNLYLADESLHRITIWDSEGTLVSTWGTEGSGEGEFDAPSGLLFDSDDNLFVVDHKNHRIQKYTKDGKILSTWGSFGDGDGQLNLPWGITQDRQGNLYVADWRNDRIQKFTPEGEFLAKFGTSGDGDGQLNRPSGVGVDSEGNIYVADWGNQRMQVFDPDGNFLTKVRGDATPNPWATEYLEAQADEHRARSTFVPVYDVDTDDVHEVSARIEPYFWDPVDVVIDDEDRVYVLDTCRHRFQIYERA